MRQSIVNILFSFEYQIAIGMRSGIGENHRANVFPLVKNGSVIDISGY
jgi:hypothetical protein